LNETCKSCLPKPGGQISLDNMFLTRTIENRMETNKTSFDVSNFNITSKEKETRFDVMIAFAQRKMNPNQIKLLY